jgi:hypothetical protein
MISPVVPFGILYVTMAPSVSATANRAFLTWLDNVKNLLDLQGRPSYTQALQKHYLV